MNARPQLLRWILVYTAVAALLSGCFGKGIRKLDDLEAKYYDSLNKELERTKEPLAKVLDLTRVNDERAIREIALLQSKIRTARLVYSLREMLTAPKGDNADFIQVTRNKVILYHLAEVAKAENEKVRTEIELAEENRRYLDKVLGPLVENALLVTSSEQALHRYFNQSDAEWIRDFIQEVQRQVGAFNGEVLKGDQNDPEIRKWVERSQQAADALAKAEDALNKFIEIWSQQNQAKP
jgi:hypothetical protein